MIIVRDVTWGSWATKQHAGYCHNFVRIRLCGYLSDCCHASLVCSSLFLLSTWLKKGGKKRAFAQHSIAMLLDATPILVERLHPRELFETLKDRFTANDDL